MEKQRHRHDLTPGSGGSLGWNWRKGLTEPLPSYPPIVTRAYAASVELSFGQQRLWFLAQLESGSAAYNVPIAWRIRGAVNLSALQLSLDQLIRRHEALRTTFPAEVGNPCQVINSPQPARLDVVDLRSFRSSERESELAHRILDETRHPFDLAAGPVLRAALFQIDQDEYVFVLTLHHIVCDGPSIAVLLDEIAAFYKAFVRNTATEIPLPGVQYADFAIWQREALNKELRDRQLAYWREQLRDCPAELDFALDRPRSLSTGFAGGMVYRDLPAALSDDFRSLSRQHGVTRFMALLALFQVLLSRYTGQDDISVGCPMTHRIRAEVARVIGFFANMMVLRARLEDTLSFRHLLRRTRDVALGAYAHQDLPFEQLVAELRPARMKGRNPFFQVMLVVEESAWRELDLTDCDCSPFPVHNGTAKFDLSLYVIDHPAGLGLSLEYNSDLFGVETAARLLEHFENLLRGVVANPDCPIFDLPLLSASERTDVLRKWNNTREDFPFASTHRLFENQVDRTPDAISLRFQGQELSYRELNARANQLARYLAKLGAGPEVLIALCLKRSPNLVVAMLAVMKSGAAYLPLDPSHPAERRRFILHHSKAAILITDQDLTPSQTCQVVCLDRELATISRESEANLAVDVRPHDLAYTIYTSGSTGRPKGVQVEHGSLTNVLCSMRRKPGLESNDVLLAVTTVAFDIAALELWLPLTNGASVVLAGSDEVIDPRRLMAILAKSNITVMQATPATWQMLLNAGWRGSPQMKILCGGEALSGSLANKLLSRSASVWNVYGPTETTIWSSVHRAEPGEVATVPIGRPIANTTMYVLDRNMQPLPVGVRGELYIGGAGVARGYLAAPDLTSERFLPDPFSTEPGVRFYRTGDLVRQRQDGTFEFLGRNDSQVKLRGFRVEPGEVEVLLSRHPAVKAAVVHAREDRPTDKRLIAYVVPEPQLQPEPWNTTRDDLRAYLETRLPDYMVPSGFVFLDELPLTASGKVDRKALPAPASRSEETIATALEGAIERRLGKIWQEVLGIHSVRASDKFFELGGDSILATQLFARLEKEFGRRLPLETLFEAPTIRKLGMVLRERTWRPHPLVEVQPGDPEVAPIFFVQARVGYRAVAQALGPDRPVYVVPYHHLFLQDTERSLSNMTRELVRQIRERQRHGPYYLGGMCLAGWVALAIARELQRQGEKVALLAIIDVWAPGYGRFGRGHRLQSFVARVTWHLRYAVAGDREKRTDWVAGIFRAVGWQMRYRVWRLVRVTFRKLRQPLPEAFRHPIWLMAEAARKDHAGKYPGRVALFRPAEWKASHYDQADLGWGEIALEGVDVYEIAGLKRALLRANAFEVGRQLKECLVRQERSDKA